VKELIGNLLGSDPAVNQNSQALSGVFVDNREYSECPSLRCPFYHKIIAPYMILISRPEPDTRALIQP